MRRKISLYIADQLVDLDNQSFILLNYTMEELANPTIVKNSFSQQITLKGTPRNNKIFGDIFRNDRLTEYSASTENGIYFDPTRKTSFAIYNELDEILESGYLKLDKVTTRRKNVEYTISLFGGLGSFLYGLTYDANGERRTLGGLSFGENLGFVIDRSVVKDAWDRINGNTSKPAKYDIINFAPCYNGKPTKPFDSNKIIVPAAAVGLPAADNGYTTQNGFSLVTLNEEVTEQETRDYRSYLQRPVLRLKKLINAICDPANNGGYTINLDPEFFDDSNPYWDKTWITLQLLNELNISISQSSGSDSFSTLGTFNIPGGGSFSDNYSIVFNIEAGMDFSSVLAQERYVMHCEDDWAAGMTPNDAPGYYFNWVEYLIEVRDQNNHTISTQTYRISTQESPNGVPPMDFIADYIYVDWDNSISSYAGRFYRGGSPVTFGLSVSGIGIYSVVITQQLKGTAYGNLRASSNPNMMWLENTYDYDDNATVDYYYIRSGVMRYSKVNSGTIRTGASISQTDLLHGEHTPADYLLSFCKTFGLRMVCHKDEKVVDILLRKNLYSSDVIDLNQRIDRSKPIEKIPFAFDARWYSWENEYEGDYAEYYAEKYGRAYGKKMINTGYDFDSNENILTEDIIFKGVCEVTEVSKYFCDVTLNSMNAPAVLLAGGKQTLYKNGGDSKDIDLPVINDAAKVWQNIQYPMHDVRSRPQFHEADNEHLDIRDVLLFFDGVDDVSGEFTTLSDDNIYMLTLNGSNPCWLPYYGQYESSWKVNSMPSFSRYRWSGSMISFSLDWGDPFELRMPDVSIGMMSNIYDQYWKKYITDRYDDDSCVVTCYVDLRGLQVNEGLLRKFFHFDNSIWALNKIINYSVASWDTIKCEFVKVQDIYNYTTN